MDEKKIAFIIASENECEQCIECLSSLKIPDGFVVEVVTITDFQQVAEAYNKGMEASDARYKIYLSDTTRILHENLIFDILKVFDMNLAIGLLGVSGTKIIPTSGICALSKNRVGMAKDRYSQNEVSWNKIETSYEKVQAIDNIIMATQYDIRWRDDLFVSNDFYDVSQSLEFKREGYLVVVIKQKFPWIMAFGKSSFNQNDCNVFLDEYSKDIFPLVSILIPTYNRPDYCKSALESALCQSYRNIEIIVGDDSSNDETEKMMGPYLEKYNHITYLKNKASKNMQPGAVARGYRNHCKILHASKGKYINYLNDDDIFHKDKISKMMQCFFDYPNVSIVTSYRQPIDKNGKEIPNILEHTFDTNTIMLGNTVGKELLKSLSNFIGEPTTVLLRRQDIDYNLGTFLGMSFRGIIDMAQWLESLRHGDFIYIDEPLSYFRVHEGQNQRDIFAPIICTNEQYKYINKAFEEKVFLEDEAEYVKVLEKLVNQKNMVENFSQYQNSKLYDEKIMDEYIRNRDNALKIISKKCSVCNQKLYKYDILSEVFLEPLKKYCTKLPRPEMLNYKEYGCPNCGAADRDRAYALWMKRELDTKTTIKMLDIAPSRSIAEFMKVNFPNVMRKTADLMMPGVDYQVDIMNMHQIPDKEFDFFLCSHVLEHVEDDVKAMTELKRILKDDGRGILVVPIDLDQDEIDEDPNCTDVAERWRRFGQDDHIRKYSKQGFLDRIKEAGLKVIEYGVDYFGEDAVKENALTDTAVVYVVSK